MLHINGQDSLRVPSMARGSIRINSKLADIKQKIQIPEKLDSIEYLKSFVTKIDGNKVTIEVYDLYAEGQPLEPAIYSIYTESPRFFTPGGIRVGMNKFDIIKQLDGSFLDVMPDWRFTEKGDKRYSIVQLYDNDNGSMLSMYFFENKLYAIRCSIYEGC